MGYLLQKTFRMHPLISKAVSKLQYENRLTADPRTETTSTAKISAKAIESIVKQAKGVTLVLLTATPMFDDYDEIIYYFNLFLWNDKRLDPSKTIAVSEIFEKDGSFKEGQEARFRGWCQDYISYIKGENPFTFPFRLPPPENLIAPVDREISHTGEPIKNPRKYLTLTNLLVLLLHG